MEGGRGRYREQEQYPPTLPAIVMWMQFDITQYEHKELREEIFAQWQEGFACISVATYGTW
ncbi:hypothetical protein EYF80_025345 [Liparis tanakae]|uniref:Uncharacterized protein n=1 Tax=Liparis tanakae TaxID=230148 RepID=A0A4Z2HGM1_9TELE|nr:hypothetical protein EYF80_025345 [Liparis tanakae]